MKLSLAISEIADKFVQTNFERLRDYLRAENRLEGFRGFELTLTSPVTNYRLRHGMGFVPKDVILTSLRGSGSVQFNYASFTATELDLTVAGSISPSNPTTVRFLAGTLEVISS